MLCFTLCGIARAQAASLQLTGNGVATLLEKAQTRLSQRSRKRADLDLSAIKNWLAAMDSALTQALGSQGADSIAKLDDKARAQALLAYAAARQTQAYLTVSAKCSHADAEAASTALAASIKRLARAEKSPGRMRAIIVAVETMNHRPIFAMHTGDGRRELVLMGDNLGDRRCSNPKVEATNALNEPMSLEPRVVSALSNRIVIKLPAYLHAGDYILHVIPQRKGWFFCSAGAPAVAALRVLALPKVTVRYTLYEQCYSRKGSATTTVLGKGRLSMPVEQGKRVSQSLGVHACKRLVGFALKAKASFADGMSTTMGPVAQGATARTTIGWPSGLRLTWDPSVHIVSMHMDAKNCKAVL